MIVGITGGIGSGKTTVTKFFSELDTVAIYSADIEAKKLMISSEVIKSKIKEEFGKGAYVDGALNSAFIASIVFKNKEKLAVLNKIVHPEVKKHFQNFVLQNKRKDYILYENAILFESKSNLYCDIIISVFVPLEVRISRVTLRDNTSKEEVLNRINNQWLEEKKILQSNYIIYNNSLEQTKVQTSKVHNILTKKVSFI
ncbi:MAG: dephospho-CoA kinase [Polaribacter sp.]|uniref:dephospho-CoA kinase n=1 Tax=Polaribacter sp. TaxID=1920175 RepID=UPI002F353D30